MAQFVTETQGQDTRRPARAQPTKEEAEQRRLATACERVVQGEVSRARQVLTASEIAPGTQATLEQLRDPQRRPQELTRPVPAEVLCTGTEAPTRLAEVFCSSSNFEVLAEGPQQACQV